ncbi:MAG: HIT domain-containing protein [Candidatus Omnitrophica bacterium]|nr:HIT domain-containing protein [Candidatus Omnitrophota bacterium]MDD5573870.1 HIT domain-containing protein [Candidatus Omnitrophota bacterium]
MKKLWAPWRIGYIKKIKKEKGCLFCRVRSRNNDREHLVFLRTEHALAMLNLYPYNNGHIMVAPLRHVKSLDALHNDELIDIMACLKKAKALLRRILKPEGFNIGINEGRAAGAGIAGHLHIHLVPRWTGDVNFMPVVSDTKVISQALASLYKEMTR